MDEPCRVLCVGSLVLVGTCLGRLFLFIILQSSLLVNIIEGERDMRRCAYVKRASSFDELFIIIVKFKNIICVLRAESESLATKKKLDKTAVARPLRVHFLPHLA